MLKSGDCTVALYATRCFGMTYLFTKQTSNEKQTSQAETVVPCSSLGGVYTASRETDRRAEEETEALQSYPLLGLWAHPCALSHQESILEEEFPLGVAIPKAGAQRETCPR